MVPFILTCRWPYLMDDLASFMQFDCDVMIYHFYSSFSLLILCRNFSYVNIPCVAKSLNRVGNKEVLFRTHGRIINNVLAHATVIVSTKMTKLYRPTPFNIYHKP